MWYGNQQTKHLENVSTVVMLIGTLGLIIRLQMPPFVTHILETYKAIPLLLLCMYGKN
jgi:hypothetical protein